jgi:hypothetical protein
MLDRDNLRTTPYGSSGSIDPSEQEQDLPGFRPDGLKDGDACGLTEANLAAFEDGELNREQAQLVEAHLAGCVKCASTLKMLRAEDSLISWEWRESAPLPFSSEMRFAVDSIMAALPPAEAHAAFARRRVHVRVRWNRLAAGLMGIVAMAGMIWSSYRIGYAHGRQSVARPISASESPAVNPHTPSTQSATSSLFSIFGFTPSSDPHSASSGPPTRISSLQR